MSSPRPGGSKRSRSEDMAVRRATRKILAQPDKVYSIFSGGAALKSVRWLESLGGTCLHGVHQEPVFSPKVALFDLDGTLIKPKGGRKFPRDADDWGWWDSAVKSKLSSTASEGFSLIIVSNQAGFSGAKGGKKGAEWKKKISQIAAQLPNASFRIFAAGEYDAYRKPLPGIWRAIEEIFTKQSVSIDKEASFFVGDAAGRSSDHSCVDRLFAMNAGLKFFTPEEFFSDQKPKPFTLPGFNPSSVAADLPLFTPSNTPLIPAYEASVKPVEIVVFVGFPSSGKTSFYREHFEQHGYVHVNQDTLGSKDKCLKHVASSVEMGKSVVVDNTNRNRSTREPYVVLASKLQCPIRCIYFATPREVAMHNDIYRAFLAATREDEARRALLPVLAFNSFANNFEHPEVSEGFLEVKTVNWVFRGTEEDRLRWTARTHGFRN